MDREEYKRKRAEIEKRYQESLKELSDEINRKIMSGNVFDKPSNQ